MAKVIDPKQLAKDIINLEQEYFKTKNRDTRETILECAEDNLDMLEDYFLQNVVKIKPVKSVKKAFDLKITIGNSQLHWMDNQFVSIQK